MQRVNKTDFHMRPLPKALSPVHDPLNYPVKRARLASTKGARRTRSPSRRAPRARLWIHGHSFSRCVGPCRPGALEPLPRPNALRATAYRASTPRLRTAPSGRRSRQPKIKISSVGSRLPCRCRRHVVDRPGPAMATSAAVLRLPCAPTDERKCLETFRKLGASAQRTPPWATAAQTFGSRRMIPERHCEPHFHSGGWSEFSCSGTDAKRGRPRGAERSLRRVLPPEHETLGTPTPVCTQYNQNGTPCLLITGSANPVPSPIHSPRCTTIGTHSAPACPPLLGNSTFDAVMVTGATRDWLRRDGASGHLSAASHWGGIASERSWVLHGPARARRRTPRRSFIAPARELSACYEA